MFFILLGLLALLEVADTWTTLFILANGGYEKNKFMKWIVAKPLRAWVFCFVVSAIMVSFLFLTRWLIGRWVIIIVVLAVIFKAKPVIHNLKVVKRIKGR